jgi:LysR family transcriptional regulator, regulator for bpeEF and oprC
MINLNEFLTFTTIVQAGSFSAGAERLGISKALATRHVADLEQALGVKLLHRTTRKLGPTAAGALFHERCRQLLTQAEQAVHEVERFRTSPGGHVKVSAAIAFGRLHVVPLVARFLQQHPQISIELHLTDRFADLVTSGHDVVIRTADEPRLLSLVARPLAPWRWMLCAAPAYLERHGTPRTPAELREHNCLLYSSNTEGAWRFDGPAGAESVRVQGNFKSNTADGVLQATLHGMGIAAITTMAAADEVRAGRLVHLLPQVRMPEGLVYASWLPNPTMPQCVQTFVHFLASELGEEPYWERGLGLARA